MRKKKKKSKIKRFDQIGRISLLTLVAFAVLVADVFVISVKKVHAHSGTDLRAYSDSDNTVVQTIPATRGEILDRDGVVIAEDNHTYNIVCILDSSRPSNDGPAYVEDKENTAKVLSEILKIDYDKVYALLNQDVYQTELGNSGRNLTKDVKDEIESYQLPGIEFTDSVQRVYPLGTFASNLIGYATVNQETGIMSGQMGFESILNNYLEGTSGSRTCQTDKNGYTLPGMQDTVVSAHNGDNVTLTLDKEIQETLEQTFTDTQKAFGEQSVRMWGSVMEVDTGKVLAWGQSPSFDPNILDITDYADYGTQLPYEAGSTMKTFVWAAAIDQGKYDSGTTADGNKYCYSWDAQGNPVRDNESDYCIYNANRRDWGTVTLDEGLQWSLNSVAATIQNEIITPDIHLDYLKKFGFFSDVDTDAVPEENGILNFTYPGEKVALSYGQGSTVTMLQLMQAYSAIFSAEGKMVKPYFIDHISDSYDPSKIVYQGETTVVGQPITSESAKKIQSILALTGAEGTVAKYKIPECSIAGKTGTSEVAINSSYDNSTVISSAVIGLPANNPKILVYVACEHQDSSLGGNMTVPVQNLLRKVAQIYSLSDNGSGVTEEQSTPEEVTSELNTYNMPSLINHSTEYAEQKLSEMNLNIIWLGNGSSVIDQYPLGNGTVDSGQKVFLLTDTQNFVIPDMTGWTRKDVAALWAVSGFGFRLSGEGKVVSQSVPAGTSVSKDTTIEVVFK